MPAQISAILAAQGKSLLRFRSNDGPRWILPMLPMILWYGMWIVLSLVVLSFTVKPGHSRLLRNLLPIGFFFAAIYWQLTPLLTASLGAALDLKKLQVYPIPHRRLFAVEVLLRVTTSGEVLLVLTAATIGMAMNPEFPVWTAPLAWLGFTLMNLFTAAGIRSQLERWMARKRVREIMVLALVLLAALPQLLVVTGASASLGRFILAPPSPIWPWTAAARLGTGVSVLSSAAVLLVWTLTAYGFSRWQFERGLRFDSAAAESADRHRTRGSRLEVFFRFPSLLFRDPLAAVMEKELRSLARTPRFRLVFLMGFTFGIIIFLPFAMGKLGTGSFTMPADYLAMVGAYALLLLGDVAFWNVFGFDRSAAQAYFLLPVPASRVLIGKNLAAEVFVILEVAAITLVWTLIRMPVAPMKVLEAYAVTLTLSLYLLGAGNLSSVHYPRAVSPERSTGSGSAGRIRLLLLLIYPAVALPVMLAYAARFAFGSDTAFWGVMAFAAAVGAAVYWIGLDSAIARLEAERDGIVQALAEGQGPISSG